MHDLDRVAVRVGRPRDEQPAELQHADWPWTATVTGAGAPLERTVLNYADRLARHERAHVKQIERAVAAVAA